MRHGPLCAGLVWVCASSAAFAGVEAKYVVETVFVETPLDTDEDGHPDRIYLRVQRPVHLARVPAILTMSPYAMGGNDVPNHDVNVSRLPHPGRYHRLTAL